MLVAAARALAAGDPLGALKRVSLRDDPGALALRGTALAQLGELPRARVLLKQAARGFGPHEALARARCVVAEAEVALALRELGGAPRALAEAAALLAARHDHANVWQARLIALRRLLLLGRLAAATAALAALDAELAAATAAGGLPPTLRAVAELARAELALRSLRSEAAAAALHRARTAALQAGVPALQAEVDEAIAALARPAARCRQGSVERPLRLAEVEALLATPLRVVDGCRHGLRCAGEWRPLARRPVLFALLRTLAEAWPQPAPREQLIARAFRTREPDETHRARLRVELGRLRPLLAPLARIEATAEGFVLRTPADAGVALLLPPIDGEPASLLALLADGAAWSTSALALALDASQRTVQRALAELLAAGRVRSHGAGRSQRWLAPPLAGFTTILLLPEALAFP